VNVTISKKEYENKVHEVNYYVNQIIEENQKEIAEKKKGQSKDDLIDLCRELQVGIDKGTLPLNEKSVMILRSNIGGTIEFLEKYFELDDDNQIFADKIEELTQLYTILQGV